MSKDYEADMAGHPVGRRPGQIGTGFNIPLYRFSQKVASRALPEVRMQAAALTLYSGGHWPFD